MRFLADENFPGNSVRLLQLKGLDVTQIGERDQGSPDEWVLRTAATQERTILTFDKDFGDLVYHHGYLPPAAGIVFFRAKVFTPVEPAEWLLRLLELPMQFAGFFTIVMPELTRQRKLPKPPGDATE